MGLEIHTDIADARRIARVSGEVVDENGDVRGEYKLPDAESLPEQKAPGDWYEKRLRDRAGRTT